VDAAGATPVTGLVTAGELGQVRFDRVISLERPRLLLVSSESLEAIAHLRQMLEAARFDVSLSTGRLPDRWRVYQFVRAVNQGVEAMPLDQKKRLEEYVREGGGFALIAGENNIYVEHKQGDAPVEKMLPAKLTPPRTPEGTAVVLIVDKSS